MDSATGQSAPIGSEGLSRGELLPQGGAGGRCGIVRAPHDIGGRRRLGHYRGPGRTYGGGAAFLPLDGGKVDLLPIADHSLTCPARTTAPPRGSPATLGSRNTVASGHFSTLPPGRKYMALRCRTRIFTSRRGNAIYLGCVHNDHQVRSQKTDPRLRDGLGCVVFGLRAAIIRTGAPRSARGRYFPAEWPTTAFSA